MKKIHYKNSNTGIMMCCEIEDGPDKNGKYHYSLSWEDSYFPGHPNGEYQRGKKYQFFHAKLPKEVEEGL